MIPAREHNSHVEGVQTFAYVSILHWCRWNGVPDDLRELMLQKVAKTLDDLKMPEGEER